MALVPVRSWLIAGAVFCRCAALLAFAAAAEAPDYQTIGVQNNLPVFRDALAERLTFPLSWTSGRFTDFAAWREEARAQFRTALLTPPPAAPFASQVIGEEDRGSYVARKVVLQLTGDSRVLALLLVPKGAGPFPGALVLHDHGGRFDIGKEKVIRPFATDTEKLASATEWVQRGLSGRFLGDELAQRGYVCLAIDALNWGDRGGAGGEGQQALASNLFHLGSSLAGLIAHEDLRAAEFLAGLPEVDSRRIVALGWSLGGFRTWQVAALSDHIAAGISVCWMATVKGLLTPGNNLTRGSSAYTMLHPGLFNHLDYPDMASIACPKPMLFFAGREDRLFPPASVEEAFAKMRRIWNSQQAGDRLVTKMWDAPHAFDAAMQAEAFAWLERQFGRSSTAAER